MTKGGEDPAFTAVHDDGPIWVMRTGIKRFRIAMIAEPRENDQRFARFRAVRGEPERREVGQIERWVNNFDKNHELRRVAAEPAHNQEKLTAHESRPSPPLNRGHHRP